MIDRTQIPRKSIYRLSLYSRCLSRLVENKVETVSSEALAKATGVKPAQLRKDLTYLGNFGRRGLGYNVPELLRRINETMGTNRLLPVALVGVGNLGSALLSYQGFAKEGFEIVAGFDIDPSRKRSKQLPIPIYPMAEMPEYVAKHDVRLAILSVPGAVAQEVTNELVKAGIQGILNFAPILLQVPEDVAANNVNLAIELENLAYFIREPSV
ncbi:MAG: redox-sensing transcriptional repressor Rex [Candidatus Methylacidiphilales bacterium]|nr:redox-sensing transcriptional repressor Rex [Candidatus Methylacidiphilales bacterium]